MNSEESNDKKFVLVPCKIDTDYLGSPSKPISMRGRSLSFSAPVFREVYSSLPESPATKFLAEFSYRDDYYEVPDFEEGKVIRNYLIGQIIGGGVYSECREAYLLNRKDLNSNVPDKVALKIITDPRYLISFRKEIEIWSLFNHPNILPLLDRFSGNGFSVAVSVLAENGNLHSFVVLNGKLSEDLSRRLFKQIASAVHYLHDTMRVAHLDIKLENILLRKNYEVYLCDFGMSFCADLENEICNSFDINDQFCSGSVTSLPPEIFNSSNLLMYSSTSEESFILKKKQDIWALGVVLYAMVMGKLPFFDDFLPRLQSSIISGKFDPLPDHLSFELKSLISKLLLKNPKDRPCINSLIENPWLCQ